MGRRRGQRHWRQLRQCMLQSFFRCYVEIGEDGCCLYHSDFDGLGTHFVEGKKSEQSVCKIAIP